MNNDLSKAARTRQYILEKTADIFNTKGYAGTSLMDLTEATGLTKGSIYGNFLNKEDVALAAFDYNLALVTKVVQERMERAESYCQKLFVYAQFYYDSIRTSFPVGGCPILNTAVEADDTNSLLKNRAAKAILSWKKTIVELIKAGIDAGEFRPDAEPDQTALSIIALIEGGIMIARVTNSLTSLDKVLKTVEMLLNQLKVSPGQ